MSVSVFFYRAYHKVYTIIKRHAQISRNIKYAINSGFLVSGKYVYLDQSKPIIVHEDYLYFINKPIRPKRHLTISRSGSNTFIGQGLLFTINGRHKVFDYTRGQVLTVMDCKEIQRYEDKITPFANGLRTTFISANKLGIVERFIKDTPRNSWDDDLLVKNYARLLEDLTHYTSNAKISYSSDEEIIKKLKAQWVEDLAEIKVLMDMECKGLELPVLYSHCDLHFGNALYDGERLWYIDFEYARQEFFLYDIFNTMIVEYMDWQSTVLIDRFMHGDDTITAAVKECFAAVGMNYDDGLRIYYFKLAIALRLIFFIDRAKSRFMTHNRIGYYYYYRNKKYSALLQYITKIPIKQ